MNPPLEVGVTVDYTRTTEGYSNSRDRIKSITCNSYRSPNRPEVGLIEMVGLDVTT